MFIRTCFIICCFFAVKACSNKIKLENEISFKIESAEYQSIISGVKGGGSYIKFFLKFNDLDSVSINGLYYKNSYAELKSEKNLFTAQMKDTLNNEGLLSINENLRQKEENTSNSSDVGFDLQLDQDEAILHFTENSKEKYYKLKLTKRTLDKNDYPM